MLKMTEAGICGSDLHMLRGDPYSSPVTIPPDGRVGGHEGTGVIAMLGEGVTTDFAGNPVKEGDRVVHVAIGYCGRCKRCLRGDQNLCVGTPVRPLDPPPPAIPRHVSAVPSLAESPPTTAPAAGPPAAAASGFVVRHPLTSHHRNFPSSPPLTRDRPPGANATQVTSPSWAAGSVESNGRRVWFSSGFASPCARSCHRRRPAPSL